MHNIVMVSTDILMPKDHTYRQLKENIDINILYEYLKPLNSGASGFGNKRLILVIIWQFLEGISERVAEKLLLENIPAKWFSEFSLTEKTPTYSSISKFKKDIIKEDRLTDFYQKIKTQIDNSNLDEIKKSLKLEKKLADIRNKYR